MFKYLLILLLFFNSCYVPKDLNDHTIGTVICDGKDDFKVHLTTKVFQIHPTLKQCLVEHEQNHVEWFRKKFPRVCVGLKKGHIAYIPGYNSKIRKERLNEAECLAYQAEYDCLRDKLTVNNFDELILEMRWIQKFTKANFGCNIN